MADVMADPLVGSHEVRRRRAHGKTPRLPGVPIGAEALRAIPLFAGFSDENLEKLAPRFNELSFPPGHSIAKEGNPGFGFFVIESGSAKVTVREEERRTLGPGSYFGEIAMLSGKPRTATIIARSAVSAIEITRETLDRVTTRYPEVREVLQRFYKERAQATVEAMLTRLRGRDA